MTSSDDHRQIFGDISNFKTPKSKPPSSRTFQSATPHYFTASKQLQTPSNSTSTTRRRPATSALRRLKAFELEQSKSCRKELIKKERLMKSLAKSLTVWLNFLFENPSSCGIDDQCGLIEEGRVKDCETRNTAVVKGKGKRMSVGGGNCGGRLPKRLREVVEKETVVNEGDFWRSMKKYGCLRDSLKEVCSLDDLVERMRGYLSLDCCLEVFNVMTLVLKNIDEGRLKMRAHCPMVTDVGMREKAVKVLMCYNPVWLRIGLYIILGGESLLPNEDSNTEHDTAFLKMVIEKQLLAHVGLARAYAYNKRVDGLYRPGYYESLGNVILKRFLLLVLILDRGKSQSSLPIKYGIDGVDGGSPLLFNVKSNIKSSRQMINDFLSSDVMHGEGNLLAHLVIVGYKVLYHQIPLVEYNLTITDLFQDIQDGVRLCRAIHLLQHDSSIFAKMVVPADTQKKKIANCGIALHYLKQAGVSLQDDDGTIIEGEDVTSGDKEQILTLLWNMFVQLQLPLLITKTALAEEIATICKPQTEFMASDISSGTHLDMLLSWMKAICKTYDIEMESLASLVDGKVMWCLLDFYFRKELHCSCSMKEMNYPNEESIVSMQDATDAVHNLMLSQKMTTLMGNFPEVLQICEILEYNGACNEKSVIILLVFLSSQLLVKKRMDQLNFHKLMDCRCQNPDRKWKSLSSEAECNKEKEQSAEDAARNFRAVQSWWQEMAKQNSNCTSTTGAAAIPPFSANKCSSKICRGNAAIVIQSHIRRVIERKKYLKMKQAVSCLELYIQAWLIVKKTLNISIIREQCELKDGLSREIAFMVDRHRFVKQKKAATLIQKAVRTWISQRCQKKDFIDTHEFSNDAIRIGTQPTMNVCSVKSDDDLQLKAPLIIQDRHRFVKQKKAATLIQKAARTWISQRCQKKDFIDTHEFSNDAIRIGTQPTMNVCSVKSDDDLQLKAALIIQSHFRGWLLNKRFQSQVHAASEIQSMIRSLRCVKNLDEYRASTKAAVKIQRRFRGWLLCRRFQSQVHAALEIQSIIRSLRCMKNLDKYRVATKSATVIQSHTRGWSVRKRNMYSVKAEYDSQMKAAVTIQRHFRGRLLHRRFQRQLQAASEIQSIIRCLRCMKSLYDYRVTTNAAIVIQSHIRGWNVRKGASQLRKSIIVMQSLSRRWLARRVFLQQKEAATIIQRAFRVMMSCRAFQSSRQAATVIQCIVRGRISRAKLLGASSLLTTASEKTVLTLGCRMYSTELKLVLHAILILQRWWKRVLAFKSREAAAVVIQSYARGYLGRCRVTKEKHHAVIIQAHWTGYLARKHAKAQLIDLRLRIQKTAATVEDGMRIINRLIAALKELKSMKNVSGILHNCATLNLATTHSQKCCERLVDEDAIAILLFQIGAVTQSIPDQEVLKHCLSTLRNLAKYAHLADALISHQGSVEIILRVFLRNKEEGYFIAGELLKKLFTLPGGIEALHSLPSMVKRLSTLVDDLTRKFYIEKRNPRCVAARENTECRLKEAMEVRNLIKLGFT